MIPGRMNPQINQLNVNTQQQISSPARSPQQSHQQISPNYGNQRSYGSPQQSPQNKQISPSQLQSQAQQQANERSLLQRCLEAPTFSVDQAHYMGYYFANLSDPYSVVVAAADFDA
jgi:hypothetical protein